MADPVSWLLIESGWRVAGADGSDLGKVHEVVGDKSSDIFSGLAVSPGLLRGSRFVPSERVARITEGRVELDLTEAAFERLDEQTDAPTSAEIRPDTTDIQPER
ncbi:MAG: hypothetical protein H0V40_09510 [Actinobacteria bacterium]|nr:hypothetical protein [Actinomycetota bacterium]